MSQLQKIICLDPNFSWENEEKLDFYIQISSNAITYSLYNPASQTLLKLENCIHVKNIEFELKQIFDGDIDFSRVNEVNLIYQAEKQFNIPAELDNELYFNSHWELLKIDQEHEVLRQNNEKINHLFSVPKSLINLINERSSAVNWHNFNEAQLNMVHSNLAPYLSIDFGHKGFQILYKSIKGLEFQRAFEMDNLEEFAYLLQVCLETLSIDKHSKVFVSGLVNENDNFHEHLKSKFNQVEFIHPLLNNASLQILQDYPLHYFSLLTSFLK